MEKLLLATQAIRLALVSTRTTIPSLSASGGETARERPGNRPPLASIIFTALPPHGILSPSTEGIMKLSKSTTILINVALVLLIAILVKSLIAIPKNVSAAANKEYSVVGYPSTGQNVEQMLNEKANEGWNFIFAYQFGPGRYSLIFER
jgi:hypothetical protein